MGGRWSPNRLQFFFFFVSVICLHSVPIWSLNTEGLILLEFRVELNSDPHGALANWNVNDNNPCSWFGVLCIEDRVQVLDLNGLSLEGNLAPVLGKLSHLKSLVLPKNRFSGTIPKEFGKIPNLEVLDLRDNDLSGEIPAEISELLSLKRLFLHGNKFEVIVHHNLGRLNALSEIKLDESLTSVMVSETKFPSRKFGNFMWQESWKESSMEIPFVIPIKGILMRYLNALLLPLFSPWKDSDDGSEQSCYDNLTCSTAPDMIDDVHNIFNSPRRRLLQEQSSNLAAVPVTGPMPIIPFAFSHSSGSFLAISNPIEKHNDDSLHDDPPPAENPQDTPFLTPQDDHPHESSRNMWNYFWIIPIAVILFVLVAFILFLFRKRAIKTIGPWKTGLSGQLQKAFVTGVPKLNRSELETACEDFSNIIQTFDGCTIYKGTLSSGVEIAVASAAVCSLKEWSKSLEKAYRKKIDTLSRINHKNFVNLIGYCEEDEPFCRMMVFEYAPNGTLFEHLHVKELEHLDWNARMRVIMGTAYCLQHMQHDLNPPISHSHLNSHGIYLTDDYAAKIAEICFGPPSGRKSISSGEDEAENSELPPMSDPETNVYCFGLLLLEIISGKLQYSEEHGHLVKWAADYLNDKKTISYMIDPTLKSFKDDELAIICEVIQLIIQSDLRHRPTMKEVTAKLREVINISPEQATPRLSPLWWAELEILSAEAT
ncbi:hypothetical protein ACFE04_003677 [Oxalis oulophora]